MRLVRVQAAMFLVLVLGVASAAVATAPHRCRPAAPCGTALQAAVLARVDAACPCDAAASGPGYRRCWKQALAGERDRLGDELSPACRRALGRSLATSLCGRPGKVLCRTTSRRGRTACRVVGAGRCPERTGRQRVCVGFTRCTQVCSADATCAATPPTTVPVTSTTTSTTSTLPGTPVAVAGPDQEVLRGAVVTLDGTASTDPDGQALAFTWLQRDGPDVTGGTGSLHGSVPDFAAPSQVSTVAFDLIVRDGANDSAPARVRVWVMEDPARALFVDGDAGDDVTGDGSRAAPFATLVHALSAVDRSAPEDVYVRSRTANAAYDHAGVALAVPDGTSLYGGFGSGWARDVDADRTHVVGGPEALTFEGITGEAFISGFAITAVASPNETVRSSVIALAVRASPLGSLFVWSNALVASDALPQDLPATGAGAIGISAVGLGGLDLRANTITAGAGGAGGDGAHGGTGATGVGAGTVAAGVSTGGAGGSGNSNAGTPGAKGGNGASALFDDGMKGGDTPTGTGGAGGSWPSTAGGSVAPRAPGLYLIDPVVHGTQGSGGGGEGVFASGTLHGEQGTNGGTGADGHGGPGGGGGFANAGVAGGGGGGGGQGGGGGSGGHGAGGGGPSIGVLLRDIATPVVMLDNVIGSGTGGEGGRGGNAGPGGPGGPGRAGAAGATGLGGLLGGSGGGGRSGSWGTWGGVGGGGGGGPSYALHLGPAVGFGALTGNVLGSGTGGRAGGAGTRTILGQVQKEPGSNGTGGGSSACWDGDVPPEQRFACDLAPLANVLVSGEGGPPPAPE